MSRNDESVLRAIFYGNYIPYENVAPKDNIEYAAINGKICDEMKYLKGILSEDIYNRLEGLEALHSEAHGISLETAFMTGFRLGVMLMTEVYQSKERRSDLHG